jgi:hypothetical protein
MREFGRRRTIKRKTCFNGEFKLSLMVLGVSWSVVGLDGEVEPGPPASQQATTLFPTFPPSSSL